MQAIVQAERQHEQLVLGVLDAEGFTSVNDRWLLIRARLSTE